MKNLGREPREQGCRLSAAMNGLCICRGAVSNVDLLRRKKYDKG